MLGTQRFFPGTVVTPARASVAFLTNRENCEICPVLWIWIPPGFGSIWKNLVLRTKVYIYWAANAERKQSFQNSGMQYRRGSPSDGNLIGVSLSPYITYIYIYNIHTYIHTSPASIVFSILI